MKEGVVVSKLYKANSTWYDLIVGRYSEEELMELLDNQCGDNDETFILHVQMKESLGSEPSYSTFMIIEYISDCGYIVQTM